MQGKLINIIIPIIILVIIIIITCLMLKKDEKHPPLRLPEYAPKYRIYHEVNHYNNILNNQGKQVIFIIHGYGSNVNCVKDIALHLKKNHEKQGNPRYTSLDIVALSHDSHDFMGMVEQCENQILQYFSNHGVYDLPRKVNLIGISVGALIAIELKSNMRMRDYENPVYPMEQYPILINKATLFLINPVIYMSPEQKTFLENIKTTYLSDEMYDLLTDEPDRKCNEGQKLKPITILQVGNYANNLSNILSNSRCKKWGSVFLFLSTNDTLTLAPKHIYKSFVKDVKLMDQDNNVKFYEINYGKHSKFTEEQLDYITSEIIKGWFQRKKSSYN